MVTVSRWYMPAHTVV